MRVIGACTENSELKMLWDRVMLCLHSHRESTFWQSRTFTINPNCRNNFFKHASLFTCSYANSKLTWPPVPKYFSRNSVREYDINSTYSLDRNKDCIPYSILYYICNWRVSDSTSPLVTSINPHWFTSTMRFILQGHNITYRFQFVSYVKRVIHKVNEASRACINSIELQCSRGWCYDILSPRFTKLSNLAVKVVLSFLSKPFRTDHTRKGHWRWQTHIVL